MTDRDKAIRILEGKYKGFVLRHNGELLTVNELIALLKAQQPRVMTPEEIISAGPEDICGIVEIIEEEHMYGCYMRRYDEEHVELCCDIPNLPEKLQKGCARIWTARPTDEQREAVKWNE